MRREVVARAQGCCEYCLIPEVVSVTSHQVDHIIAEKHGGDTTLENLALSCLTCNLRKSSDIASLDPETGRLVGLFNPREQSWSATFELDGGHIHGLNDVGRTTVTFLQLNAEPRVIERLAMIAAGIYPPDLDVRKPR